MPRASASPRAMRETGIAFTTPVSGEGPGSAVCLVFVTPDGERTMSTYLGACREMTPADLDEAAIADAKILYLEGYLWGPALREGCVPACRWPSRTARAGASRSACPTRSASIGTATSSWASSATSRSISFSVTRASCTRSTRARTFDTALRALAAEGVEAAVTRSAEGCVVVAPGVAPLVVPARKVDTVVDTTGAGDLFAAGYLAGLARGESKQRCAELGALGASEIIKHLGARPQVDLKALAQTL